MIARRQNPLKTDAKIGGMAGGTTANFANASPFTQGVLHRGVQRIGCKTQGIQKIAFSGAVLAHQKIQGTQIDRTPGDAQVIVQCNPSEKNGLT